MPSMTDHVSTRLVKICIASHSGTGKTGGMASLVDAGYHLHILDFDEGSSTLRGYVKDKAKLKNVDYIPLRDKLELAGDKLGIKQAFAFKKAMESLESKPEHWGTNPPTLPLKQWTDKDVLVVDTLGLMARSCLMMVMAINGASHKAPEIQHYGVAMENIEKFLGQVTSEELAPCHVILNTHIMQRDDGSVHPEALGDKLPPKVGRYFDNLITIGRSGGKLNYKTQQDGAFNCKTAIPMDATYPLETGLATIFDKLMKG